jgi:hypothetical protein
MTDEALRNYLGVVSFLLAALSFVAGERRDTISALHKRGDVQPLEKWFTLASVVALVVVVVALIAATWPVVHRTDLGPGDLLHLRSALRTAFVIGYVMLIAVGLALVPLLIRAWKVQTGEPSP